jgi:hypothetical protein
MAENFRTVDPTKCCKYGAEHTVFVLCRKIIDVRVGGGTEEALCRKKVGKERA